LRFIPIELVAANFEGGLGRRMLLCWVLAIRPKFLTASVLPVLVGSMLRSPTAYGCAYL